MRCLRCWSTRGILTALSTALFTNLYHDAGEMSQASVYTFLHDAAGSLSITGQSNSTSSMDTSLSHGVKVLVSFGAHSSIKTQNGATDFRTQRSRPWLGLVCHRISLLAIFIGFGLCVGGDVL
jgi:hypothetical protein